MAFGTRVLAGQAYVQLFLDPSNLGPGIQKMAADISTKAAEVGMSAIKLGAAAAAISTPFVLALRQVINFTSQLGFTANRIGIAAQTFGALTTMARLTGTTAEAIEIAFKSLGERTGQLAMKSGETTKAFQMMGVDIEKFLNTTGQVEKLMMLSDAMAKVEDPAIQSFLALRAFGEAGNQLLPILRLGSEEIRRAADVAARISPDQGAIDNAMRLAVAWQEVRISFGTMLSEIAQAIGPAVAMFMHALTELIVFTTQFIEENTLIVGILGGVALGFTVAATAAGIYAGALKLVASAVALLNLSTGGMVFSFGKILAIVVLIAGTLEWAYRWWKGIKETTETMPETLVAPQVSRQMEQFAVAGIGGYRASQQTLGGAGMLSQQQQSFDQLNRTATQQLEEQQRTNELLRNAGAVPP